MVWNRNRLSSCVQKAYRVVSKSNTENVIDRRKLRLQRQKCREELNKKEKDAFEFVQKVFMDGRNDATLNMVKKNEKYYRLTVIESHYAVVGEH